MVKKKKLSRKKVNRVVHKKKSSNKVLKKDFEVFAKGVQRLEELKVELDNLDTSGYAAEANSIRSKLKNVSYIPQIENEMRVLKSKISGKYRVKKGKVKKGPSKIHKKIKELENEIKKRKNVVGRKQLSKEQVKLVKDIPKIESQLKNFKIFLEEQRETEKRKRELLNRMDPGVSLLINNKFNLTLNEIKAELSNKLKEKQSLVQKQLQEDLEARKKNFELQYKILEDKFGKRYAEKVKAGLENEIRVRFKGLLNERVKSFKEKLEGDALIRFKFKEKELNEKESKKLNALEKEKEKLMKKLRGENIKVLAQEKEKLEKVIKSRETKKARAIINRGVKSARSTSDKEVKQARAVSNRKIKGASRLMRMISNRKIQNAKKNFEKQKSILKKREEDYFKRLNLEHVRLKASIKKEKQKELVEKQKESKVNISWKQVSDLRESLKRDLEAKKMELEREHNSKLVRDKSNLRKGFHEKILVHRAMLNHKTHEYLTAEVKKLYNEHESKRKQEEANIKGLKKRLSQEKGVLSKIRNNFNSRMKKLRYDEKNYKAELFDGLQEEKQEAIKKSVAEQSVAIKRRLGEEFHQKLRFELKAKDAEFEKKKADLALEVQRKAKELFG